MIEANFYRAEASSGFEFEVTYFLPPSTRVVRGILNVQELASFLSSAGLTYPGMSPEVRHPTPDEASRVIEALPHDNSGPVTLHFRVDSFAQAVEALRRIGV
jgi:hypothetical protein